MPIYTVEETGVIGSCRVFDANGNEIPYVITMNTDTGEVEQPIWDSKNKCWGADVAGDAMATVKVIYPNPLRLEFVGDNLPEDCTPAPHAIDLSKYLPASV